MKNMEVILSLAGTALGLLITTLTFLSKFITSIKAKTSAQNLIALGNSIVLFVEQAEKFINYSGEEKKAYVLTKANQFSIENGIKFDLAFVENKIEELINLSKEVNFRNVSGTCGDNDKTSFQ